MYTCKWNHIHPPKTPSKFEVFKDSELIYSGTYNEGIKIYNQHNMSKDLKIKKLEETLLLMYMLIVNSNK